MRLRDRRIQSTPSPCILRRTRRSARSRRRISDTREMTSRKSSGSMRAERAVEPTRSENMTLTCRRSARSSGALGTSGRGHCFSRARLAVSVVRKVAITSSSLRRCPSARRQAPSSPRRQVRQDRFVNLVLAEGPFVPFEAKAPQPNSKVHSGALRLALNLTGRAHSARQNRTTTPRL